MKTNEKNTYCVYIHTNKINGKRYVGQTCQNPNRRWQNGFGYLNKTKKGDYMQPAFARAILKHGWDNFNHEVVFSNLTQNEANKCEQLLIEKFDTTNPNKGYNLTNGGGNAYKSDETKKKMSENHANVFGANNPKARMVAQYSKDNELIKIWSCIAQAGNELHIDTSSISRCCRGKAYTVGGYIWKYYNEYEVLQQVV